MTDGKAAFFICVSVPGHPESGTAIYIGSGEEHLEGSASRCYVRNCCQLRNFYDLDPCFLLIGAKGLCWGRPGIINDLVVASGVRQRRIEHVSAYAGSCPGSSHIKNKMVEVDRLVTKTKGWGQGVKIGGDKFL